MIYAVLLPIALQSFGGLKSPKVEHFRDIFVFAWKNDAL